MRSGLLEIVAARAFDLVTASVRAMARTALWLGSFWPERHESWRDWAETKGMRVAFGLPLGVAGAAAVVVALGAATSPRAIQVAATETIAARFPADWSANSASEVPLPPTLARVADASGLQQLAMFSPAPTYSARPEPVEVAPPQPPAAEAPVAKPQVEARPERVPLPVPAPARRNNGRPEAILNDAQIASVKARLHLTPDQERMWPAVEAALRDISYSKTAAHSAAEARVHGKQVASIDPNSSEVQKLKYAAFPLLMSFSEPQKEEVRSLTRLMGLEQLASMF